MQGRHRRDVIELRFSNTEQVVMLRRPDNMYALQRQLINFFPVTRSATYGMKRERALDLVSAAARPIKPEPASGIASTAAHPMKPEPASGIASTAAHPMKPELVSAVGKAVARLRPEDRERYMEEWMADGIEIQGRLRHWCWLVGLRWSAFRLTERKERRAPVTSGM
jgi:hypothetical protein